jgi:hypothetical protein
MALAAPASEVVAASPVETYDIMPKVIVDAKKALAYGRESVRFTDYVVSHLFGSAPVLEGDFCVCGCSETTLTERRKLHHSHR